MNENWKTASVRKAPDEFMSVEREVINSSKRRGLQGRCRITSHERELEHEWELK